MSGAARMIDTHPRVAGVDTTLHSDTIDVLVEAARASRQCADACIHEAAPMADCISATLDASDIASATVGIVIRLTRTESSAAAVAACREVLRVCADVCRQHGAHLRHCAACAEVCDRAEDMCVQFEAALRSRPSEPA